MRNAWIFFFSVWAAGASFAACVGDAPDAGSNGGDGGGDGGGGDATTGGDSGGGGDGSSDTDAGVDSGPKCGYAGEECCGPPLKDCVNGTACVSGKCKANDIWIVGEYVPVVFQIANTSAHYNGTSWSQVLPIGPADGGTNSYIASVFGFAPGSYLSITQNDLVFNLRPGAPDWNLCGPTGSSTNCPALTTTKQLSSIFGFSTSDYWIAGVDTMLHCNGPTCTPTTTGLPVSFGGGFLAGTSSTNLYYALFNGAYHYDGVSWSTVDGLTDSYVMWARAANDVWGASGNGFQHWDGSGWSSEYGVTRLDGGAFPGSILSLSGSTTDDVWAGGETVAGDGFLIHWDGTSWKEVPIPSGSTGVVSVWTASKIEAYAATYQGSGVPGPILAWDGSHWTSMAAPAVPSGTAWTQIFGSARPRP